MRVHEQVSIPLDKLRLKGDLLVPADASAIIIFSHGSGSSRFSPRNRALATYLHQRKFGTLLLDLLTEEEDKNYYNRFDIDLLAGRLVGATRWLKQVPVARESRIGYFGASTGTASALKATSILPGIFAVVSRGGRPDLAKSELHQINAPTLLIVGSLDHDVLQLNKEAFMQLKCTKKLEIVEGATHLFEEPRKMEIVSKLAGNWFEKYLTPVSTQK